MSDNDLRTRLADALLSGIAECEYSSSMADDANYLADVLLSLPGIAIVDSQELAQRLDKVASSYDQNKLPDHARGVRHAGRLIVGSLLAAAAAADGSGVSG